MLETSYLSLARAFQRDLKGCVSPILDFFFQNLLLTLSMPTHSCIRSYLMQGSLDFILFRPNFTNVDLDHEERAYFCVCVCDCVRVGVRRGIMKGKRVSSDGNWFLIFGIRLFEVGLKAFGCIVKDQKMTRLFMKKGMCMTSVLFPNKKLANMHPTPFHVTLTT